MESQCIEKKSIGETTQIKHVKKSASSNREKADVDTSQYTIEERLVASVWVHERKREHMSIVKIKRDFRQRFDKEPPTKNTLYLWEKKLFSTGNVMDAKRTGRPCSRKDHIEAVEKSLKISPDISSRARAAQLGISRTTIVKIMQEDLGMTFVDGKAKPTRNTNGYWLKTNSANVKRIKTDTHSQKVQEQAHKTPKSGMQKVISRQSDPAKPLQYNSSNPNNQYERPVNPIHPNTSYSVPAASINRAQNNDIQADSFNNIHDRQQCLNLNESQRTNVSSNDDPRNSLSFQNHQINPATLNGTRAKSEQRHTSTLINTQKQFESINNTVSMNDSDSYRVAISESHVNMNDNQQNLSSIANHVISNVDQHVSHSILENQCYINVKPLSNLQNISLIRIISTPMQTHQHSGYLS